MKKKFSRLRRLKLQDLVPFIAFVAIFLFFTFASYNERTGVFMMLTARNLSTILDQTMITLVVACGTLFVVAQGGTDLSVGVNLALAGVIGSYVASVTGIAWLMIPVALAVGALMGWLNGFLVARCKVSSFMVTLAMLIGVRGLVNYLQVFTGVQRLPDSLAFLNSSAFKVPVFLVILAVSAYVFEFTKLGRYSRAIGENETTARFIGIPVRRVKTLAFVLSGLMAGVGALFYISTVGATSNQMGVFLEIRVVMAIFLGGVLVTGGSSAKFYKLLLGSFSIQIIISGLALMGKSDSHIAQTVEGVLLILILFVSILAGRRKQKEPEEEDAAAPKASGKVEYPK